MFGSTVLDVAIGMIFVYLLLSLLCSAVNEYIELKLQNRSKDLWRGIQLLLNGKIDKTKEKPVMNGGGQAASPSQADSQPQATSQPQGSSTAVKQDLASELYQHGLVRALFRDEDSLPSYIPSRTFALALWNLAAGREGGRAATAAASPDAFSTTDLKKIKEVLDELSKRGEINKELAQALGTLIDEAKGDFNKAVKNVEDWYDGAMDRVSGWYKRRVQKILIVIGFVTAFLINADSVNIAKALIQDKALRDVVVASADEYLDEQSEAGRGGANANNPNATAAGVNANAANANATNANAANAGAADADRQAGAKGPDGKGGAAPSPTPTPTKQEAARQKIDDVRGMLFDLGLPIGWAFDKSYKTDPRGTPHLVAPKHWTLQSALNVTGWALLKLFGLLLTGLAISQGAPFWFDLLNKFMVIRSTVKPKEKSREQPSKDRPAPETDDDVNIGKG